MSLRTRLASLTRLLPKAVERGYGTPPSNVDGWGLSGFGMGSGSGPHEPFAGAWQRNMDNVNQAGPSILAFSAVYTCINIISSDISRMPLRVLKKGPKGNREPHKNHPAWGLLQKPNIYQTSLQFVQQYLVSKLTTGNAYVILLRDGRGVPYEMYVLDPRSVHPLVADDGSVFYRVGQDKLANIAGALVIPARDIIHDRMACMHHPLVGTSPLFAAGVSAMTGARILINSEQFFANMSRSSGVLTAPGKIDKLIAKEMQQQWEQNYGGKGMGRTAVLSNGLKYEAMTINAADAELVNQLRWTVEDVARCYRVPGFKLGDLNKVTYKNSEQMEQDYFQNCLSYHIEAYEQAFNVAFGLSSDVEIEFDLSTLFRLDAATRYAAHDAALNSGWKSINEIRLEEDLPPVKGGEEPRVQAQYIPLSLATGAGVHVPGTPNPGAPGAPGAPLLPAPPKPAPTAPIKPVAGAPVAPAPPKPTKMFESEQLDLDLDLESVAEIFRSQLLAGESNVS